MRKVRDKTSLSVPSVNRRKPVVDGQTATHFPLSPRRRSAFALGAAPSLIFFGVVLVVATACSGADQTDSYERPKTTAAGTPQEGSGGGGAKGPANGSGGQGAGFAANGSGGAGGGFAANGSGGAGGGFAAGGSGGQGGMAPGGVGGMASGGAGGMAVGGQGGGSVNSCGDGKINPGEECDDANGNPDDGCTNCVVDCDPPAVKHPTTHHCYRYFEAKAHWVAAESHCVVWGGAPGLGHLVSIDSAEEQEFVQKLGKCKERWIGATDVSVESQFAWSDGSGFVYENWRKGEPNDHGSGEDCAELEHDGRWDDQPCTDAQRYICERTPAHASHP